MGAEAEVFPAWTEADWRKAAEAALKGASLDKLVTRTADGLRIEPVYQPAEGPRALARPAGLAGDRPARPSRRPRSQCAGARGSRGRGRRPAGRVRRRDRRLWLRAQAIRPGDARRRFRRRSVRRRGPFRARPRSERPGRGARLRRTISAATGAEPAISAVSFGLDPFAAAARGPFPADWAASRRALSSTRRSN